MLNSSNKLIGIGDQQAHLRVYMQNKPEFIFANSASAINNNTIAPLKKEELHACGQACGNGWRKVFNLYAKLIYAMAKPELTMPLIQQNASDKNSPSLCWQNYRDHYLLQANSNTALFFEQTAVVAHPNNHNCIHIIMGRTYARSLNLPFPLHWENKEFAVNTNENLIVSPYFDYRQLSNSKLLFLLDLVDQIINASALNFTRFRE